MEYLPSSGKILSCDRTRAARAKCIVRNSMPKGIVIIDGHYVEVVGLSSVNLYGRTHISRKINDIVGIPDKTPVIEHFKGTSGKAKPGCPHNGIEQGGAGGSRLSLPAQHPLLRTSRSPFLQTRSPGCGAWIHLGRWLSCTRDCRSPQDRTALPAGRNIPNIVIRLRTGGYEWGGY